MISTYNTYDYEDPEKCEIDEVVLSKEFPGYTEELSYLSYNEFLNLIERGLELAISRFGETEKEKIFNQLEKARNALL